MRQLNTTASFRSVSAPGATSIAEDDWNVAMNMMYSDYCSVAAKYGVNKPEFFADMAKAFLFDKDAKGPKEKLSAYYHGIAAV